MSFFVLFLALVFPFQALQATEPSQQMIVGLAESWKSSKGTVQVYNLRQGTWVAATPAFAARFGRNGLKWGLGRHENASGIDLKREGDGCTPAGVFALGDIWGYASSCEKHHLMPYHKVSSRSLWVEDSKSPSYNKPLLLPHEPKTSWEKKAQMRQNDYAHSLKLFIKHNAEPKAIPQMGSSIFFHIWRQNGRKPTAGCTTMSEKNLRSLVKQIDPSKNPLYVVLPKAEYAKRKSLWKLP